MDKSWMTIRNRLASTEYEEGVKSFLQFAMGNLGPQPEIRCPCNECLNGKKHSFEVVKIHLIRRGIDSSYKTWVHHGEYVPAPEAYDDDHHDPNEGIGNETGGEVPKDGNQMQNMVEDVFVGGLLDDDSDELPANIGRGNVQSFDKLFNAAQRKIYPGGEKTVLAFIVEMLHVKVYKKMPNDTFNIMMNVIKGMRQDYDESIPWNTYEAKKFLRDLGLGYVPIHACINDCALFWKENGNMENCPKCNEPRYKVNDDCIMPPGSKKSSASSNSTSTMHNTAAVQVGTGATTPALEILTSTPLTFASPSTRASASGAPSAKRRRVRGPTRGKRIQRIIAENKGERISVYVTPEMRAFCGINANKVASELGTQIRWQCPIQGFYSSWNDVADQLQRAVIQAVRDKFKVTENGVEGTELVEEIFHEKANLIYKDWKWRMNDFYTKTLDAGLDAYQRPFQEMPMDDWKYMIDHVFNDPKREPRKKAGKLNREAVPYGHTTGSQSFAAVMTIAADREEQRIANEGNDDAGNGNEPNSNESDEGNTNEGRKKLDICDLFEASYRLRDTNEWINSTCKDKHEMMVATRDEAALSGTPLSTEELSIKCLGESTTKNYIRGLGTGPKPSTYLSKSNSQSASQDQLQKLQRELDLIREEQRQREEEQRQREEKYEEKRR